MTPTLDYPSCARPLRAGTTALRQPQRQHLVAEIVRDLVDRILAEHDVLDVARFSPPCPWKKTNGHSCDGTSWRARRLDSVAPAPLHVGVEACDFRGRAHRRRAAGAKASSPGCRARSHSVSREKSVPARSRPRRAVKSRGLRQSSAAMKVAGLDEGVASSSRRVPAARDAPKVAAIWTTPRASRCCRCQWRRTWRSSRAGMSRVTSGVS